MELKAGRFCRIKNKKRRPLFGVRRSPEVSGEPRGGLTLMTAAWTDSLLVKCSI